MSRERLTPKLLSVDTHDHEDDVYSFISDDNKVVGPVIHTGRQYQLLYEEPVLYGDGENGLLVSEVCGTFVGLNKLANVVIMAVNAVDGSSTEIQAHLFGFLFHKGDSLVEIEQTTPES